MSCGFDIGCHINAAFPWWPWALGGIVVVLLLVALAKVKELAGWPGVFGILALGLYGFGYFRGRKDEPLNPIENIEPDSPDAAPSHRGPKHSAKPPKGSAWDKWRNGEQP